MIRFIALFTFCALFTISTNAQSKLFNSGDKVVVQISNTYGKVYVHEMSPKQTVYTLAKTFGQRMKDVESVNPGVNFNAMNVGQKIRVPFLAASIVKNPADLIKGGEYVYVYYKIRPKDNLYRIAKVYFDTSIENLMAINKTSTFDLKADELIKVGWMPIGNTPMTYPVASNTTQSVIKPGNVTTPIVTDKPTTTTSSASAAVKSKPSERTAKREKPKKRGFFAKVFGKKNKKKKRESKDIKEVVQLSEQLEEKPIVQKNTTVVPAPIVKSNVPSSVIEQPAFESKVVVPVENIDLEKSPVVAEAPLYTYKREKGIAIWNQTSTNSKNMFVLHPTAAVGSYIEITNPMMNKTVNAKVIGNIPPRTYTDDVSIVVSPRVAKMLGVVDRRFAVQVKYRE